MNSTKLLLTLGLIAILFLIGQSMIGQVINIFWGFGLIIAVCFLFIYEIRKRTIQTIEKPYRGHHPKRKINPFPFYNQEVVQNLFREYYPKTRFKMEFFKKDFSELNITRKKQYQQKINQVAREIGIEKITDFLCIPKRLAFQIFGISPDGLKTIDEKLERYNCHIGMFAPENIIKHAFEKESIDCQIRHFRIFLHQENDFDVTIENNLSKIIIITPLYTCEVIPFGKNSYTKTLAKQIINNLLGYTKY